MMSVPLKINDREFDLFVILEEQNLARIRAYDPAEIVKSYLGPPFDAMQIRNVMLAFASPEEVQDLPRRFSENPRAALRWLSRGFRFRPEKGDHDGDYQRLAPDKKA